MTSGGEVELSLEGLSVCIAIPSYSSKVPIEMMTALTESVSNLRQKGIKVAIITERGNALIDLARNRIVTRFLEETDYNKIFWLDDDIVFKPDDMERLIAWSTLYPIVGATYPCRIDTPTFFIRRESDKWVQNEYGLFDTIGFGCGFVVMDRSVFDTMRPTTEKFVMEGVEHHKFFSIEIKDGTYFGEDIYFFRRWHDEFGGKAILDPSIELQHVGVKYYDFKFVPYLQGLYKV